jgi:hypothetical protein
MNVEPENIVDWFEEEQTSPVSRIEWFAVLIGIGLMLIIALQFAYIHELQLVIAQLRETR